MKPLPPPGPIRVGVLGCSDIACRRFLPALRQSQRAALIAVGSGAPSSARIRLNDPAIAVLDYDALLKRADIDLIYLSLPNHLHEEWAIRALAAGKHVLCEKPLGLDAATVARMHEVAADHGRLLYENLMYLHHPQHAAVKKLVASGRLGRIDSLRATFTIPALPPENFRNDPARGGGAFHDQIRYPLSAACYFLAGEHYTFAGRKIYTGELLTALHGTARTEKDETFHFSIGFGLPYRSAYEVSGECGSVKVERAFTTPADLANEIVITGDGRDESISIPPADHFLLTIEHVCALLDKPETFPQIRARNERLAILADDLFRSCHAG